MDNARRMFCGRLAASLVAAALALLVSAALWSCRYWLPLVDDGDTSCILRTPSFFKELMRPPIDCQFCRNISSVVRRRNLTKDDFEINFAYSGCPLIVEDGTVSWESRRSLNFGVLKELYEGENMDANERCQFFPYKSGFRSLADVFRHPEEDLTRRDAWYIGWQACDRGIVEKLRKFYRRPYFLPEHSEGGRSDWIFIGSPGYGAALHVDDVGNPTWQAQLTGFKEWTLQPPPECFFQCPGEFIFTVKPGEIFVFDSNMWYHSTKVVGNDISMSIGAEYD